MLNKLSWSSFASLVALMLAVYYLYIFITLYRKELFSFVSIKNSFPIKSRNKNELAGPIKKNQESSSESGNAGDESFTIVHELLEDLKKLFSHAAKTKMVKEELTQALRSKLSIYPGITETDLVEDINHHLIEEAKDQCFIELFPEDLKRVWSL